MAHGRPAGERTTGPREPAAGRSGGAPGTWQPAGAARRRRRRRLVLHGDPSRPGCVWGSPPPPPRGPSDGRAALQGPALAGSRIPRLGSAPRAPRPAPPSARPAARLERGRGSTGPAGRDARGERGSDPVAGGRPGRGRNSGSQERGGGGGGCGPAGGTGPRVRLRGGGGGEAAPGENCVLRGRPSRCRAGGVSRRGLALVPTATPLVLQKGKLRPRAGTPRPPSNPEPGLLATRLSTFPR